MEAKTPKAVLSMEGLNRPHGAFPWPTATSISSDSENPWEFSIPVRSSPKHEPSRPAQSLNSSSSANPPDVLAETSDSTSGDSPGKSPPTSADSPQLPEILHQSRKASPIALQPRKKRQKAPAKDAVKDAVKDAAKDSKERYIAIGIDFGTT